MFEEIAKTLATRVACELHRARRRPPAEKLDPDKVNVAVWTAIDRRRSDRTSLQEFKSKPCDAGRQRLVSRSTARTGPARGTASRQGPGRPRARSSPCIGCPTRGSCSCSGRRSTSSADLAEHALPCGPRRGCPRRRRSSTGRRALGDRRGRRTRGGREPHTRKTKPSIPPFGSRGLHVSVSKRRVRERENSCQRELVSERRRPLRRPDRDRITQETPETQSQRTRRNRCGLRSHHGTVTNYTSVTNRRQPNTDSVR